MTNPYINTTSDMAVDSNHRHSPSFAYTVVILSILVDQPVHADDI